MLCATRAHSWSQLKDPKMTWEGGAGVSVRRGKAGHPTLQHGRQRPPRDTRMRKPRELGAEVQDPRPPVRRALGPGGGHGLLLLQEKPEDQEGEELTSTQLGFK